MGVEAERAPATFRFWVRRTPGQPDRYAVRYEVEGGLGILRVARPGLVFEPPGRTEGLEEGLTTAQLRGSRFTIAWEAGARRRGYILSRLEERDLRRLDPHAWYELQPGTLDGFHCLRLEPDQAIAELDDALVEALDEDPLGEEDPPTDPSEHLPPPARPARAAVTVEEPLGPDPRLVRARADLEVERGLPRIARNRALRERIGGTALPPVRGTRPAGSEVGRLRRELAAARGEIERLREELRDLRRALEASLHRERELEAELDRLAPGRRRSP